MTEVLGPLEWHDYTVGGLIDTQSLLSFLKKSMNNYILDYFSATDLQAYKLKHWDDVIKETATPKQQYRSLS